MNEIDTIYLALCEHLLTSRAVGNTKELNNVQITLDDINQNIVSVREISPSYLFGEWLWYFTGRNDVEFISQYGSMWKKLSDDGTTNNSAYGYIMQKKFGFDQVKKIIELLKKDPSTRRAVININTPNEKVIETKDEPCTIALQFMIRKNKLNCTAIMRSNDIWLGFPYDVAFFTELQKYIADELGVAYGTYVHFVVSMHLYDRNYEDVKKITNDPVSHPVIFDRTLFHKNKDFVTTMISLAIQQGHRDIKQMTLDLAKNYFNYRPFHETCQYYDSGKCKAQRFCPKVKCFGNVYDCERRGVKW